MSDNENQPQLPSKQTSSVPLKKETVRVTLKAADAPPAVPSATVPMAPPVRPPVPGGAPPTPTAAGGAPRPPAPAPTIPLRTAGAPTAPGAPAPTIPLRTAGAPSAPGAPAPTIRLATSTAPIGPPGAATKPPAAGPSPTIALKPAGAPSLPGAGSTPTLPKATVQLQAPTQPLGTSFPSASQAATLRIEEDDEDDSANDGLVKILAGVGFAAALALLAFQLMLANTWISAEDNPRTGDWSQLLD